MHGAKYKNPYIMLCRNYAISLVVCLAFKQMEFFERDTLQTVHIG